MILTEVLTLDQYQILHHSILEDVSSGYLAWSEP